ncbi:MAG: hypothetical protein GY810_11195 [Aureispira sp.]|nr:hypothetical protein [Aureispira sp.]
MKFRIGLFFVATSFILFWFTACQTGKSVAVATSVSTDVFSEDYYVNNAANNLERLKLLLTGLYVQRNEDTKKGTMVTWTMRDGADSILLYAMPVGDPLKDGHWLYVHQFISNSPDDPVYSAFQEFKQKSRDSIETIMYENPLKVSFEDLKAKGKDCFRELVFDELKENGEHVTYIKESRASFEGYSKIYKNPRADANDYRKDEYHAKADQFNFRSSFYGDIEGEDFIGENPIISHLIRLDPEKHELFAKRKKK